MQYCELDPFLVRNELSADNSDKNENDQSKKVVIEWYTYREEQWQTEIDYSLFTVDWTVLALHKLYR